MSKRPRDSIPEKKYIQEICAVIDRSGSMRGKEEDTICNIQAHLALLIIRLLEQGWVLSQFYVA